MSTTEQECLDALREAAEELGKSPTKKEYEELGTTPSAATILRVVGGWNEAKERAGLETNASRGSRVQPKPDDVVIPEDVEWAELSQDQRWHYRNVEWNTERTLRRRAELRAWVNERKAEQGCTECGESDPACLDMHHREGADKEMEITEMVTYGYSRENLRDEMAKCVVMCANCHQKRHDRRPASVSDERSDSLTKRERLQRWEYGDTWAYDGVGPPPLGMERVPENERERVNEGMAIVERIVNNPNRYAACHDAFATHCTDSDHDTLPELVDKVKVWRDPGDGLGEHRPDSDHVAYSEKSYRIGRWTIAATIIHELAHMCGIGHGDDVDNEDAVAACGLPTVDDIPDSDSRTQDEQNDPQV